MSPIKPVYLSPMIPVRTIVENKLLGHTLRIIADAQRERERDESRLENQRMTLRDQDKLRRAMAAGFEGGTHERQYRVNKPPTYSAMRLAITAPTDDVDPQPPSEREVTVRAKPRTPPFIAPKRPVGRPPKNKPVATTPPMTKQNRGALELSYTNLPRLATADPNPLARILAWAKSQTPTRES